MLVSHGTSRHERCEPRAEPGAGSIQYEPHLLDSVPSPMMRALPVYERDFRGHLLRSRALWEASQNRLRDAEQLLSELVSPFAGSPPTNGGSDAQPWVWGL